MNTIHEVYLSDSTVNAILKGGGSLESCVVALAKEKHELAERCMRLVLIAPKKVKGADGKWFVWHCPDELVPESK